MTQPQEQTQEMQKAYARIVQRAWSDPAYKARLLADPRAVLAEEGLSVAPEIKLRIVENTADRIHLVVRAAEDDGAAAR